MVQPQRRHSRKPGGTLTALYYVDLARQLMAQRQGQVGMRCVKLAATELILTAKHERRGSDVITARI